MAQALQTDLLLQSVGITVKNHHGERIGKVIEVTRDKHKKNIEYLILQCDILFGKGKRFFAIPASAALIKIPSGGEMILHADKDQLRQAKGLTFEHCPKPTFKFEPSIYELYQYHAPADRTDSIPSHADT